MESSLTSPLPVYEAVFYRRSISEQHNNVIGNHFNKDPNSIQSNGNIVHNQVALHSNSNEIFQYHNHILIGNHLYYILRPLRPNHSDVGKFRLVLVQGTSKGRLRGIRLTQKTNIHTHIYSSSTASSTSLYPSSNSSIHYPTDVDIRCKEPSGSPRQVGFPTAFMITLNGTDFSGKEQVWQLAMPSEEVCSFWAHALRRARDFADPAQVLPKEGNYIPAEEKEELRALALKMCSSKGGVGVRKRFSNFKLFARSFVGSTAVKWIMKEKSCTVSQALAIGTKMLVYGFISHVSNEHLFCAKNILYRFSAEIDPLVLLSTSHKREAEDMDDSDGEDEDNNLLMNEMSHDAISLTICQNDLKTAQAAVLKTTKYANIFLDSLIAVDNRYQHVLTKFKYCKKALIGNAVALVIATILYFIGYIEVRVSWNWENHSNLSLVLFLILSFPLLFVGLLRVTRNFTDTKDAQLASAELREYKHRFHTFQKRMKMTILKRDESDSDDNSVFDEEDTGELNYEILFNKFDDESFALVGGHENSSHEKEEDTARLTALSVSIDEQDDIEAEHDNNEEESDENILSDDSDEQGDSARLRNKAFANTSSSSPPRSALAFVSRAHSSSAAIFRRALRSEGRSAHSQQSTEGPLPRPSSWPHEPVLIKRALGMIGERDRSDPAQLQALLQPIRIHKQGPPELSAIPIDNDYFVGKCFIWIAHLKDTPVLSNQQRQRKLQYIIQGRFKTAVPFSSVYTGQIFRGPFQQLPNKWVMRTALGLIKRLQPGLQIAVEGDNPYLISPLISTCQVVNISRVGAEPSLNSLKIEEDLSLLGAPFESMTSTQRKIFFSKPPNLPLHSYSPDFVYTFDFYQHLLNLSTFQMDLGFMSYDFVRTLGPRPIDVMAVVWNPLENNGTVPETLHYLYDFEIWHRKSLPESASDEDLLLSPPSPAGQLRAANLEESSIITSPSQTGVNSRATKKKSKFQWLRVSPAKPIH